jgi:hypothetical protein
MTPKPDKPETKTDKILRVIRDNPIIAFVIVFGVIVIAIGAFTDALKTIKEFIFGTQQDNQVQLLEAGYDFVSNASRAHWSNGSQKLIFPGSRNDNNGFVYYGSYERLETGDISRSFLETHPKWESQGIIQGKYGPFKIPNNLNIRCQVGFLEGAQGTDGVVFRIDFVDKSGNKIELYKQVTNYDKKMDDSIVNLEPVAGKRGYIILSVDALESAGRDWAVWNIAKVVR